MTREDFVGVVRNAHAGMGFDQDASMVTFPIDPEITVHLLSHVIDDTPDDADGAAVAAATAVRGTLSSPADLSAAPAR